MTPEAGDPSEDARLLEIIEVQSRVDARRPELKKVPLQVTLLILVTLMLLAVGVAFGGYMWWFFGLWVPMGAQGTWRVTSTLRNDRRDKQRLTELGFEPMDPPENPPAALP